MEFYLSIDNELELVQQAKQEDIKAFSELVRRHEREIRIYLSARLDSVHEAEDLAQETFVIAYRRMNEFEPLKPIKYWFRAIAQNLLNNYKRKNYPIAVGGAMELEQLINARVDQHLVSQDEQGVLSALHSCMESLSEQLKILLVKHYSEGYTVGDLAKLYALKHSTLTMRLHRVRDKLRKCINEKLAPTFNE